MALNNAWRSRCIKQGAVAVLLLFALSACGQKGDLFLPPAEPTKVIQ